MIRRRCSGQAPPTPPFDAAWLAGLTTAGDIRLRAERLDQFAFGQRAFVGASPAEMPDVFVATRAFRRYRMLMVTLERMGIRNPAVVRGGGAAGQPVVATGSRPVVRCHRSVSRCARLALANARRRHPRRRRGRGAGCQPHRGSLEFVLTVPGGDPAMARRGSPPRDSSGRLSRSCRPGCSVRTRHDRLGAAHRMGGTAVSSRSGGGRTPVGWRACGKNSPA